MLTDIQPESSYLKGLQKHYGVSSVTFFPIDQYGEFTFSKEKKAELFLLGATFSQITVEDIQMEAVIHDGVLYLSPIFDF